MQSCFELSSMFYWRNLCTDIFPWVIFPNQPYFPCFVTAVIVEPVPAYYLDKTSPFSAQRSFNFSKTVASPESPKRLSVCLVTFFKASN